MNKKSIALSITIASSIRKLSLAALVVGCFAAPMQAKTLQTEIVSKPQVNDDQVTLRVKVKGENNRPEMNLKSDNFQVLLENQPVKFTDWKNPEETTPPSARIIVLLDFSGSMQQPDMRGTSKFSGALEAIKAFIKVAKQRGGDTQVAIVPFGQSRGTCQVPPVNDQTLNTFLSVSDSKLQDQIANLANQTPCASTDIYTPLGEAVNFLARQYPPLDPKIPEDQQTPRPRLSVIVLSDGFQNTGNEKEEFDFLKKTLSRNPEISVHTLGYGKTPKELGREYKCDQKPATRADIGVGKCKVPPEEFVDQIRLQEMAKLTGGIALFSANPQIIAQSLNEFLNALLGEYEITYTHPNPERGKTYEVQAVVNKSKSNTEYYRFLWSSLPLGTRLVMFGSTLTLLGVGGVVPFWLWGKYLKQKALED